MPKINIKPRTGKDFFEFTQRTIINTKLAQEWAIEQFVLIDDRPITIEEISRLKTDIYIKLTSSIFTNNITPASEDNTGIEIEGNYIKIKRLSRDFVAELQAVIKIANGNTLKIMKYCLTEFYDISVSELENMPYQVAAYLFNKINFFLGELSEFNDEFYIDELFDPDPGSVIA
jgi:hypothetical protein